MSSGTFLVGDDNAPSETVDQAYDSESVLQDLLFRRIHSTRPLA